MVKVWIALLSHAKILLLPNERSPPAYCLAKLATSKTESFLSKRLLVSVFAPKEGHDVGRYLVSEYYVWSNALNQYWWRHGHSPMYASLSRHSRV